MGKNTSYFENSVIDLIDKLTSSEGNFPDTSIKTLISDDEKEYYFDILLSKIVNLHFCDRIDILKEEYYNRMTEKRRLEMEYCSELRNNNELIKYIQFLVEKRKPCGWFVKENVLEEILLENPPETALQIVEGKSVEVFLNEHGPLYLLALTRIYEKTKWHSDVYELYSKLSESDFEFRDISLINIEQHHLNEKIGYMERIPMWDDKIGGSVFVYNKTENGDPLRMISKYYHYEKELYFHSRILESYHGGGFNDKFIHYFLQSENDAVGFFEPHSMIEAACWEYSINNMYNDLFQNEEQIKISFSGSNAFLSKDFSTLVCDCMVDFISNDSKGREFPGKHRMFAMLFKYNMLREILKEKNIDTYLIENADRNELEVILN